ncbi:hypothetical protein SAMN02744102_01897, partial [Paenibacillus barengoltzii]
MYTIFRVHFPQTLATRRILYEISCTFCH